MENLFTVAAENILIRLNARRDLFSKFLSRIYNEIKMLIDLRD